MKTRILILVLILSIVVLIITSSSASASDIERFFQAVRSGDYAEVKRLIEKGADVNVKSNNGYTALMGASQEGHTDIAKLIIEAGAKE